MRRLFTFILTSGIFSSTDEDLDILPPPPPFPKIGAKSEDAKVTEKAAKEEQRRVLEKEKELKLQKKREADEELRIKKEKALQEKERLKAKEQQRKYRGEKLFKFLHGIGLVKTEGEKKQIRKGKEEYKNLKLQEKKKKEEMHIKAEQERIKQKGLEKATKQQEADRLQKEKLQLQKEEQRQKLANQKAQEKERLRLEKEEQRQILLEQKTLEKERLRLEKPEKLQQGKNKEKEKTRDLPKIQDLKIPEKKRLTIKEQFSGLFPKMGFGEKETTQQPILTQEDMPIPKKIKAKKIKEIPIQSFPELQELQPQPKTGFKDLFTSFGKKNEEKLDEELKDLKTGESIMPETGKKPKYRILKEKAATERQHEIIDAEKEIQEAIDGLKGTKKRSSLSSIFTKKEKVRKDAIELGVEMPHVMPRTYDKIDNVEIVEAKIHKARIAVMDFNFDGAKRIYIEIMGVYNKMESKEKQEVYDDIKDLYYERKNAERFAKK